MSVINSIKIPIFSRLYAESEFFTKMSRNIKLSLTFIEGLYHVI